MNTENNVDDKLAYPIGKYIPQPFSEKLKREWMKW